MTAPLQVLPGIVYLVTRRTERQVLLFRPDALMEQVFLFCVAWAAQLTGVEVHGFILLSDHEHLVVTDTEGRIGEFAERLHWLLTKCTQALRGWEGRVFDGGGVLYTELTTADAVVDKIGYTVTNAMRHGLVRTSSGWPGPCSTVEDIGGPAIRVERPPVFFRRDGEVPEVLTLRLTMPRILLETFGEAEARRRLEAEVERREETYRASRRAEGRGFLGARRVMQESPFARAKTRDDRPSVRPRWAGSREAVGRGRKRRASFLARYADCLERWRAGERDILWPAGTYRMRRVHGVRCADPPE